jgi:hypothetical protein
MNNLDLGFYHRTEVFTLLSALEDHDIELLEVNRYQELIVELLPNDHPPMPESLLTRTPAELHAWALASATRTAAAEQYRYRLDDLRKPLDRELKAVIRASASNIVAQLRVQFDAAADGMRAAVALGIRSTDTIETLFHASDEKRTAWSGTHQHAETLDSIFQVRQLLSTVAEVPPVVKLTGAARTVFESNDGPSGVSWSVTVIDPASGAGLEERDDAAPWARWIAAAAHLQLVDPAVTQQQVEQQEQDSVQAQVATQAGA